MWRRRTRSTVLKRIYKNKRRNCPWRKRKKLKLIFYCKQRKNHRKNVVCLHFNFCFAELCLKPEVHRPDPPIRQRLHRLLAEVTEVQPNNKVSISPKFYEQLFWSEVFCTAFIFLQFGFVIFWQKNIGVKTTHKMLVKLTKGVNFTNMLCSAFTSTEPKSAKKTDSLAAFFCAFGIFEHKSRCKMLAK